MSRRPGTVDSAAGRKAGTDVAAGMAVLAAGRRVDGVAAAAAVGRLVGRSELSEVHESPEDVAVQAGAAMQFGQGVPAADGSLGSAGAETGEAARIVAAAAAAVGNDCSEGDRPAVIALEIAGQLAVVDNRRCVAAVGCLDCTAERSQGGGLELIAEGRTGMCPNSGTAE